MNGPAGLLLRWWSVEVDPDRLAEYSRFERAHSLPMFESLPGCLGVQFLRQGNRCSALSWWSSRESIDALPRSHRYRETVAALNRTQLLVGPARVEVFEVSGGWQPRSQFSISSSSPSVSS